MTLDSVYDIADMLETNQTLKVLDLSSNYQALFHGVPIILRALQKNKTLRKLYANSISSNSKVICTALCKCIEQNEGLEYFEMAGFLSDSSQDTREKMDIEQQVKVYKEKNKKSRFYKINWTKS